MMSVGLNFSPFLSSVFSWVVSMQPRAPQRSPASATASGFPLTVSNWLLHLQPRLSPDLRTNVRRAPASLQPIPEKPWLYFIGYDCIRWPIPKEIPVVLAYPHSGGGTKDLIIDWPDGDEELGVALHREHLAESRKHKSGLEPEERKMAAGGADNNLFLHV